MAIGINLDDETDPEVIAKRERDAIRRFEEQFARDEARIEQIADEYFYQRGTEM